MKFTATLAYLGGRAATPLSIVSTHCQVASTDARSLASRTAGSDVTAGEVRLPT